MSKQIRIKSKTRFCIFLTVVTVLITLVMAFIWNGGKAASKTDWIEIEVVEGDTLWHIAKRTLPLHTDIREYIYQIREANRLKSCNIKVGQKLYIPIY